MPRGIVVRVHPCTYIQMRQGGTLTTEISGLSVGSEVYVYVDYTDNNKVRNVVPVDVDAYDAVSR